MPQAHSTLGRLFRSWPWFAAVGAVALAAGAIRSDVPVAGPTASSRALAAAPGLRAPVRSDALHAVSYDVADLIRNQSWRAGSRMCSWAQVLPIERDAPAIDVLVATIMAATGIENWRASNKNAGSIQIVNGTRLEIQASARRHAEIVELFDALRRLADIAVVTDAELLEIDRTIYDKEVAPILAKFRAGLGKKLGAPIPEDLAARLRKHGIRWNTGKVMVADRGEAEIFSLRRSFLYVAKPVAKKQKPADAFASGFHGFSFKALVAISADRRSVQLKVTQTSKDLTGISQEVVRDVDTDELCTIDVPALVESSVTSSVRVDDGEFLLFPVHSQSIKAKDRDRVLVLLVYTWIYIAEEEKARGPGSQPCPKP